MLRCRASISGGTSASPCVVVSGGDGSENEELDHPRRSIIVDITKSPS